MEMARLYRYRRGTWRPRRPWRGLWLSCVGLRYGPVLRPPLASERISKYQYAVLDSSGDADGA